MVNRSHLAQLALFLATCSLAACSSLPASSPPTPTPLPPTEAPTATAPPVAPTATAIGEGEGEEEEEGAPPPAQPCEIVAEREVTVYQRPSSEATVFGSMAPGFRVHVQARTAAGWLGFDPGVAQAANVGVFRLRWVAGSSAIRLEGPCDRLPELVGPPAGICFTMPMDDVPVYTQPDGSSQVIATLVAGDYAAVIGRAADRWARVDLSVGNTGLDLSGWIEAATLNLSGPCEDLPALEP